MIQKRMINFRPVLFAFLFLCFGLLFAKYCVYTNILQICFLSVMFLALLIYLIYKKLFKSLLVIIISFAIGLSLFLITFNNYSKNLNYDNYEISGTVESCDVNTRNINVVLKDIKINGNNHLYKIKLSVYNDSYNFSMVVGDKIIFDINNLNTVNLVKEDWVDTINYKQDIRYTCNLNASEINIIGNKLSLFDKLKSKISEMYSSNMSNDNSSLSKAILYGDKSDLDSRVVRSYRVSGVAHLLAISGLHIGFLVSFVLLLLKKRNRLTKLIVSFVILMLYCILCGFSSSVVRASIMAIIILIASCLGEQNDFLSSISLSGVVILLFKPLIFFDVSFLLSFGSVFGIALLSKPIKRLFVKIKMPKILSEALAISLSSQIFILPISAYFFHSVSIIGIVLNIIAIPIFTIGYYLLIIFTIIGFIIPTFSVLLVVPDFVFTIINLLNKFIVNFTFASIEISGFSFIGNFAFYVIIILVSDFINIKLKTRIMLIAILFSVFVPTFVVSNVTKKNINLNYNLNTKNLIYYDKYIKNKNLNKNVEKLI